MTNSSDSVQSWLELAQRDLRDAVILVEHSSAENACYLSAQSAEKSLKALLAFLGLQNQITHNLLKLSEICEDNGIDMSDLIRSAGHLNPFSTRIRYDAFPDVTVDDAKLATSQASKFFDFAQDYITHRK